MKHITPLAIPLVAIAAIAGLEFVALWRGVDGVMFSLALALIGAIAGVKLREVWPSKK